MNPSRFRTERTEAFKLENGMLTVRLCTWMAFLIRVNISAIVSVIIIALLRLYSPTRLSDSGNGAFGGELAEGQSAYPKLSIIGSWPYAELAAVAMPHCEFRRSLRLHHETGSSHASALCITRASSRRNGK